MRRRFDPFRQNELAEEFHKLHYGESMLVLPNVWDSLSANVFEKAGFPALATTSSGISWSCGYKDGEHIPPELMVEMIERIAYSTDIPVTADIEGGYYRDDFDKFSEFMVKVVEAGAVGVNLEDSNAKTGELIDIRHQMEIIRIAKEAGRQKGVNLFVNARVDTIEKESGDMEQKIKAGAERAESYKTAGADGVFVPFINEIDTVAKLKSKISLPLNILANQNLKVKDLRKLKINRVSVGGKPVVAAMNYMRKIASELGGNGEWPSLYVDDPTYPEINNWF